MPEHKMFASGISIGDDNTGDITINDRTTITKEKKHRIIAAVWAVSQFDSRILGGYAEPIVEIVLKELHIDVRE